MIGIKELQKNPAVLTKSLEKDEIALISKRGKPLGIAVNFDDMVIEKGLKTALLVKAYKAGDLSLGELSKYLELSYEKTMKLLSAMGIDVVDYDFEDDIKFIENFNDCK